MPARPLTRRPCPAAAAGLDRNEAGALLVAAGLGSPAGHALVSLLALNGLRVPEAVGADVGVLIHRTRHRIPCLYTTLKIQLCIRCLPRCVLTRP